MKNILKTLLILILLIIPFSVSAQQEIYSSCEYIIFENHKYYKLSSIASVHNLTLQWNDSDKSVMTAYNGKKIVFNTANDIVYINGERYYFGDIILNKGFTYISEDSITIFNEGYTAYLLNSNSNIKYIEGKITRIDVDNDDKLTITDLKKYDLNQSLYFCIDEFADMYNIVPQKSADNDYIMISNGNIEMYFYVQTDYVGYNGSYFTSGDILIKDGKFYAPETVIQFMLDVFLPDFASSINDSYVVTADNKDKYTTYIFDDTNIKYVSLKEVSTIHGYKYQWYYVNKYAEVKTSNSIYYILVPTNVIMKENNINNTYRVKEENDIVYIEYDALSLFGLIDSVINTENNEGKEIGNSKNTIEEDMDYTDSTSDFIPVRQLSQKVGGSISWDDATFRATLAVNDVKYIFDTKNMRLFINEIEIENPKFKFENGITLVNTSFEQFIYSSSVFHKITDNCDILMIKSLNGKIKTHYALSSPNRIVVDLLNVDTIDNTKQIGTNFNDIRIIEDGNIKRLVIDLKDKANYEIIQYGGYIKIVISSKTTLDETTKIDNKASDIIEIPENEIKISTQKDQVKILTAKYEGYTISRISDPNRIEIFIPDTYCEESMLLPAEASRYIKTINTRYEEKGSYVSIVLTNQCRYEILEKSSTELLINIYSQKITNMSYLNSSDRKYIQITGIALADQYGKVNSNVKITYDNLVTEIYFIDTAYRLTAGVLYVNDEFIEKIQIKRVDEQVRMLIYAKQPLQIYMNSARLTYTNINLLPVDNTYSGCVVIDAGHGGYDPGAVANSIYESKINLSVAKKVEQILISEGIKVFMTRNTDDYVGLYERAHIANMIKASLFVSIHSNAFANTSYKGIMTLVYPSTDQSTNITGKSFGKIIQNNLIRITGANDRGVIDRPNLVVLNSTKMPAALIECGFMTNPDELAALQTDEYQNILAQGIARGIIDSMSGN